MKKFALVTVALLASVSFAQAGAKLGGSGVVSGSGQISGGSVNTNVQNGGKATVDATVGAAADASGIAKTKNGKTTTKTNASAQTATVSNSSLSAKGANSSASSSSKTGGLAGGAAIGGAASLR